MVALCARLAEFVSNERKHQVLFMANQMIFAFLEDLHSQCVNNRPNTRDESVELLSIQWWFDFHGGVGSASELAAAAGKCTVYQNFGYAFELRHVCFALTLTSPEDGSL